MSDIDTSDEAVNDMADGFEQSAKAIALTGRQSLVAHETALMLRALLRERNEARAKAITECRWAVQSLEGEGGEYGLAIKHALKRISEV